jgi:hypothetical protein
MIAAGHGRVDDPGVYRTVTSRQRRIATAALWFLTMLSGMDVVGAPGGLSWIHIFAGASALFLYADPLHRIWPRRRVTLADLPILQGDLRREIPDRIAERVRVR